MTVISTILMVLYLIVVGSLTIGPVLGFLWFLTSLWWNKKGTYLWHIKIYPWYVMNHKYQWPNRKHRIKRFPFRVWYKVSWPFCWLGMKIYWMVNDKEMAKQDEVNYTYRLGLSDDYYNEVRGKVCTCYNSSHRQSG